ncbi:hypothetical protein PIB30_010046 [Stylosanthes scabra]|uniref:Pectinesterase n=1 Tax=Stylosanthes scabra TaxID=79078 RepID=A0ABU6W6H6_9FABA|nr:hypothetical protein [Stylosanthes scabra]
MALKVTMEQAIRAHKLVSTMESNNLFKDNKKAKMAWEDCLELYEDTIYQLNRSITTKNLNDRLTWQSASIANHQTCQNGFIDFNLNSHLNYFPSVMSNFSKLLSNSLSITKAVSMLEANQELRGRRRLLLSSSSSHGFPEWLSVSDRRLLQAATPPKADVLVAQDGSGSYKTITEGVAAAARIGGGRRVVVHVKAGVYRENVVIKKTVKNIMIVGDGIDATVVTGNGNAQDGSTTFRSATFGAAAHLYISIMTGKGQGHSDHSVFYRCSFKGYQDTLYVYAQRQFYRDCDVYGTVDFIFGDAVSVLQNCNIYVRRPMSNQQNTVTAQGRTDPNENTGIIIHNCRITAAGDMGSVKTFLGRPWQKYSRTVVMKSGLGGLINPAGWAPWSGSFALSTLYYGEYMNTGPGANTAGRVHWPGFHVIRDPSEAVKFSVGDFLAGGSWIPGSGVPFDAGL